MMHLTCIDALRLELEWYFLGCVGCRSGIRYRSFMQDTSRSLPLRCEAMVTVGVATVAAQATVPCRAQIHMGYIVVPTDHLFSSLL
jgi:hypothetical protein